MNKLTGILMVLGVAASSHASWTLLDDFDSYDNSSITTIGANGSGDCTAGVWDGVFDGTGNATIYDNAGDAADNELTVWGIPGQGANGWRGAQADLANNFPINFTFADNSTQTIFFQFMASSAVAGNFDCMFGLTDTTATLDNVDAWKDFAVMPFLAGGGVGAADFQVSEGVVIADVAADTWYNVWLVVNTTNNTFDVYSSTGTDDGVLAVSGSAFRNGKGLTSLQSFGIAEREAGQVRIDNIYVASGENTLNPVAAANAVLLDDFSGDLSAYTNTRIQDSDGGAHNTATWQIGGGALELNTSSQVSFAEQYAFIRTGLSLGVNEEIQADISVSGSQDLGLYVGGTTPVTDVRQDYVAVYARGDGSVYSRGFDGSAEYALAEAGVVVYDKLFIKRTATNTYEAGYYDGDTRTVVITRTPSTPNDGGVVGFYADVRAGGTLGSADNLTLLPSSDTDGDGLLDEWEQQIVDGNPGDGITNIINVLPGDDFDGDGFSNGQEYELGLDPIVADPSDTDSDGDYLPDLWEYSALGMITYNSYDDPDSDGYNNQAERLGGTDPLLDTDHPDWTAPTVGYMRDSVVASNALLMGGGSYGHAINGVSFQDQIIYTFEGYQYTAYYDTAGSVQKVCLARRTVDGVGVGEWEVFQTDSEFINGDESAWDAHNVIAFGICAQDGTLHMAWDHHNNTLRYRSSVSGVCTTNKGAWGSGMLNAEQNWLVAPGQTELDVTYPQFVPTPDGGLVLNRRIGISGNGDQLFQVYNPSTGAWNASVQFINRSGTYVGPNPWGSTVTANERCAYINGFDIDPTGTIHVTWTWRESASQYGNRDICYAYSPDMGTNWYNSAGDPVANTSLGEKITMNSPGITVVPLNMRKLMINQQAQCVDNDERVHVLVIHRRQDPGYEPSVFSALFSTRFTAYYHYFRDPGTGEWTQRRIPPDGVAGYGVGSRPCIGYDAQGNVYAVYTAYPAGTDVFPGYLEAGGKLVIASASKASQYTDWEVLQVVDVNFDGEPLLDQARLLSDNILTVYIQEHVAYSAGAGIPATLHAFEYAVDISKPETAATIAYTFRGDDVLISAFGQSDFSYQLQSTMDLTNGWSVGDPPIDGMDSLIAFPNANGLQHDQSFYTVLGTPAP